MKTVGKALRILDLFTEESPVLALRDITLATGLDKATCHRMLKEMALHGYVEQSAETRKYSLGATLIRLARAREVSMPISKAMQLCTDRLVEETGETCHASLIAGMQIATVAVRDGTRQNRVHVDAGGRIEPHATATGMACLGFAPDDFVQAALSAPMSAYSATTATTPEALMRLIEGVRARGYGLSDGSFDPECIGLGAPVFGPKGYAIGALAVATPASRMTPDLIPSTAASVMRWAIRVSVNTGGIVPKGYLALMSAIETPLLAEAKP